MLALEVAAFAVCMNCLISLSYKLLSDQQRIRELKKRAKYLSKKLDEARRRNEIEEMNKIFKEAMENNKELMRLTRKPMLVNLLLAMLLLYFANQYFKNASFALPILGFRVGWIAFYILASFATFPLVKRLLKVSI